MVPSKERKGHQKEPLCLCSAAAGANAVLSWPESSERIKGAPWNEGRPTHGHLSSFAENIG